MMSLQHHAAAAEEGKGAAGGGTLEIWGWWWWWRVQRTWLGRPLRPLPLPARGRDHSRFLACQSCRPLQAGGRVYGGVFLAEGRPVLLCTREDASLPPRHSLEFFFFFFFRACMCVSVCMAVLPRAKCILRAARRRGGGAPADLQILVRDGLFSLRQVRALRSLVDTPPFDKFARGGICFKSSPMIWPVFFPPHGAAEKKLERSPPSHPKGKQIKD